MNRKSKASRSALGGSELSRRRFLGYSGATGALAFVGLNVVSDPALAEPGGPTLSFSTVLRRREDQLRVEIEFYNLTINAADGGRLQKTDATKPAYVVYDFGPQHLAEEAFFKSSTDPTKVGDDDAQTWSVPPEPPAPHPTGGTSEAPKPAGQVRAVLANNSRLAFEVPDAVLPMAYTTSQLLDWLPLRPRVVESALPRGEVPAGPTPLPRAPLPTETAIEYPWHLVLSPHQQAAWAHEEDPVDHGTGRYELWHTRLAARGQGADGHATVDEDHDDLRTVRAVWGTDKFFGLQVDATNPSSSTAYQPFRMALSPRDRLDIVRLSSDWRLANGRSSQPGKPFTPEVVEVDRLALSSLGAWLDSSFVNELMYASGSNYNSSLLQWQNVGAMGRDAYTRVVRKGWLFPFGFKAALVTVTERQFNHEANNPAKPKGAYLRQRVYIVVLKADRDYAADARDGLIRHQGRRLPFRRVSCLTRVTPDLENPQPYVQSPQAPPAKSLFMPKVGVTPFRFRMRGSDWAGRAHSFDAPVVFVEDEFAYESGDVGLYLDKYSEAVPMHGARVAFAEEIEAGDTTFPVSELRFAGEAPALNMTIPPSYEPDEFARLAKPAFFPAVSQASIAFSDASAVAGRDVGSGTVEYWGEPTGVSYLTDGFGSETGAANKGDVFLVATNVVRPTVGVSTRNAGGMAAPALPVHSVSRLLGPTGPAKGPGQGAGPGGGVSDGVFDPAQVLDSSVKILGGIALVEVLQTVGDFVTEREKALKIVSRRAEDPNRVITEVDWHPTLQPAPMLGAGLALFAPGPNARCDIHAEIVADLDDPDASSYRIDGRMDDFVVNLFGGNVDGSPADGYTFVRVPFRRLSFRAGSLVQETFDPELGEVSFHGPLAFLEELARFMALAPGGGGSVAAAGAGAGETANGPYLDVTDAGIEVGVGFALPEIGVGVLTLSNLALHAGLRIPFDGSAVTLDVGFSSRNDPFSLSVWGIGGGGFAGVTLSIAGVELLEFALEFGASIGFSVGGIASGKVEIKAGIYFKVETVTDEQTGAEIQECTLEAYIRLHGELDILGLISVSITFYLGLSYNFGDGSLSGEATVTIEIEVAMFSDTVTMTVRKKIAGGGGSSVAANTTASAAAATTAVAADPLALEPPHITWADLLTQTDWNEYCNSFATVPA